MRTHLIFPLIFFLLSFAAYSAETAPSFAEARKKASETKSDFIICAYGEDWDTVGMRFKKQVWDVPSTFSLIDAGTVISTVNILDSPSKEEAEKQKEKNKGFGEGLKSLPQIYLFDSSGHCYATLYGNELPKTSDKLAKELQELQSERKKRDSYIEQSGKASSAKEKARLLGMAGEIPGLNRPKFILDEIKKIDAKDESGYIKRFTFNIFSYQKYLKEPKDTALKAFDEVLSSPAYTAYQKQQILGLQSTYLRRNKGSQEEIKNTLKKMRDLDPNSLQGKAAVNAAKTYVKES